MPLLDNETGVHPRIDPGKVEVGRLIGDIRALARLAAAVEALVEIGTGKVLSGLVKRTLEDVAIANLDGADDLDSVLAHL